MRTWPAIDAGRLKAAPTADTEAGAGPSGSDDEHDVGAGFSRPEALQAALTDFDVAAVHETLPDSWRVFFHAETERDRALAALRAAFPDLIVEPVDVPDEDWAARSQADVRAVRIGDIIVAPPWDVPTVITIQPSTGFGTGHHATTRLCLTALQRVGARGRTVIDVGTGSAVLAIAASLRGGEDVTGVDDDADAIRAAWENLSLNPAATVTLLTGDFRTMHLVPSDMVLANLTGALLISAAPQLRQLVAPGGRLILSGFMTHEERDVLAAFAAFSTEHRDEEEEWVCVTLA